MKKGLKMILGFVFISLLPAPWLPGKEIIFYDSAGEPTYLSINSSDQFDEVIDDIALYVQNSESKNTPISLNLLITDKQLVVNSQNKGRDYYAPLTSKEKKDLDFIIKTIAWEKNLIKLWDLENDLEKAKERIFHLHPFKFLEAICTDQKLCAGLKAIEKERP